MWRTRHHAAKTKSSDLSLTQSFWPSPRHSSGPTIYLGRYGSPESREAYARLLAETFRPGTQPFDAAAPVGSCSDLTMNELMVRYLGFAEHYYVKDGKPTKELTCMKEALGHLREVIWLTLS